MWKTFLARGNRGTPIRCMVCDKEFKCRASDPFPLWQHLLSMQGQYGHPSRSTIARWCAEEKGETPDSAAGPSRPPPWQPATSVQRSVGAASAEQAVCRPLARRWKSSPSGPPPAHLLTPSPPSVPPPAHLLTHTSPGNPIKGQTALKLKSGQPVCTGFNSAAGCVEPCPRGVLHVCSVLKGPDGRVCGSKRHNAINCPLGRP